MDLSKGPVGIGGIQWWHRIRLPDGTYTEGQCHHGPDGGDWPTTRFGMPEDLTGKTVLDIGAWDGFFSFEAEKRNAKRVIATDVPITEGGTWAGSNGLKFAIQELKSKVKWDFLNIEHENFINNGPSDLVMCFGVLYHIKSPLKALENLFELTADNGICLIETAICKDDRAILEYRPNYEGDPTNYFYPSESWIYEASNQCGFITCDKIYDNGERATFRLTK